MIKDYLNTLKNTGNFTVKEIEKLSGVPVATVRKVLSGDTDDPRFDTVVRLVTAMGGSLSDIAEKKATKEIETNSIVTMKEMYDDRICDMKEHIKSLTRDKKILAIVAGVFIVFVGGLLVLDISVGTHGWIRY
jgi:predicted transcriptional regulator